MYQRSSVEDGRSLPTSSDVTNQSPGLVSSRTGVPNLNRLVGHIVRSTTPVASGILSDLVRLVESPHTPSPSVTSSGHSLSSTDSHPHVHSALHMRRTPLMVPPHSSRTLNPEIALMHHLLHMMFAHHNSYPHRSDLRLPQDPSQHLHQSSIMYPKSEQKVTDDLSKVLQRKNHVPSAS
ncbi:protein split ends [Trichonephila clavipes]|nr:protein split ends [Trichonephila clavipes]